MSFTRISDVKLTARGCISTPDGTFSPARLIIEDDVTGGVELELEGERVSGTMTWTLPATYSGLQFIVHLKGHKDASQAVIPASSKPVREVELHMVVFDRDPLLCCHVNEDTRQMDVPRSLCGNTTHMRVLRQLAGPGWSPAELVDAGSFDFEPSGSGQKMTVRIRVPHPYELESCEWPGIRDVIASKVDATDALVDLCKEIVDEV